MPVVQPYHPGFSAFLEGASQVAGDIGQTRRKYRDEDREAQALEESLATSRQNRELNTDANTRANAREGRDAEFDGLRNKRLQQAIDQGDEQSDVDLDEYDANTRDSLQGIDWEDLPEETRNSIAGTRRQELAKAKGPKRKALLRQFNDLNRRDIDASMRDSTLAELGSAVSQGRFADNPGAHESASMLLQALHSGVDQQGRPVDPRQVRTLWKQLSDSATEDDYQMNERASVSSDIDSVLTTGMSRTARAKALRLRADLRHHKVSPEEAQDELDLITQGAYDTNERGTGGGKEAEDPLMSVMEMVIRSMGKDADPKVAMAMFDTIVAKLGLQGGAGQPDDGVPELLRRPPGQTDGPALMDDEVPDAGVSEKDAQEARALPVEIREQARDLLAEGRVEEFNKLIDEHMLEGSVLKKDKAEGAKAADSWYGMR